MPIKLYTEIFPKQQQLLFDTLSENVSWEDIKKKIVFEVSKAQSRNGLPA